MSQRESIIHAALDVLNFVLFENLLHTDCFSNTFFIRVPFPANKAIIINEETDIEPGGDVLKGAFNLLETVIGIVIGVQ